MIKTKLNREDAFKIMELGKSLHEESKYRNQPFDAEKCWAILDATVRYPEQMFIAYDDQFRGFIIMKMGQHYFSGSKEAGDLALYIQPEHRGGSLAVRLIDAAEKWSKENGAEEMTIYHSTGINTEKAEGFFNRKGLKTAGYIFTKELTDV